MAAPTPFKAARGPIYITKAEKVKQRNTFLLDCRPLKSMSLSANSFTGAGVTSFWGEFLLVVLIVCGSGLVCLDTVFGIFSSDSVVGLFPVSVRGGLISAHWTRQFKARINAIHHNIWLEVDIEK